MATVSDSLEPRPLAEQAVRAVSEQSAEIAAEKAAERAAIKAVEFVFLYLGIDINDKEALRRMREQLEFVARVERGATEIKNATIKTCVGAFFAGLFALLLLGYRDYFK
jgi:hypothetical protein